MVLEVKTILTLFHRWLRNVAKILKWHKRDNLLFFVCLFIFVDVVVFQDHASHFNVTRWKILSSLTQIERFWTATPVWIHRWLRNDGQSSKWHRREEVSAFTRSSVESKGHTGLKVDDLAPISVFSYGDSNLNSQMAMKWRKWLPGYWKGFPIIFQGRLSNFKIARPKKSTIWIRFQQDY